MKFSRQREAVLECLKGRDDHPTADALFRSLREEDPKISLRTVYRNLSLLTQLGRIRKISCGDGVERYDYITGEHYHFICESCGRILDVESKDVPSLNEIHIEDQVGVVRSHSLTFYGLCKDCKENN